MKILRSIVFCGCVGLLAFTAAACNRGEGKKQQPPPDEEIAPIGLNKKQDKAPPPWNGKGIDPATVAEYERLGGVYGSWVKAYDSPAVSFQVGQNHAEESLLGFRFSVFPKEKLPDVAIPFGLELAKSDVTDIGLKDLADLKNLIRLDLDPAKVTDATLHSLNEIGLLHSLWLATKVDGSRPRSAAEVYSFDLRSTKVTASGLKELAPFKKLLLLIPDAGTPPEVTDAHLHSLRKIGLLHAYSPITGKNGRATSAEEVLHINLDSYPVTDAGLKELAGLENVSTIHLQNSKITDLGLKELAPFKNLTQIVMTNCRIRDAGLKELAGLKKLSSLHLMAAYVTDVGLKDLTALNLSFLDLGGTHVTNAGLKDLPGSLNTLYLNHTQVTDVGLKQLAHLKNLTILNLSYTKVADAGLKDLQPHIGLSHLWLHGTQVTDAGVKNLLPLKNLYWLELGGTKVADAGLKDLAQLKNLGRLGLSHTKVTDVGLKDLAQLKNLHYLDLTNTKVTYSGVQELRAALPKCQIVPEVVPAN